MIMTFFDCFGLVKVDGIKGIPFTFYFMIEHLVYVHHCDYIIPLILSKNVDKFNDFFFLEGYYFFFFLNLWQQKIFVSILILKSTIMQKVQITNDFLDPEKEVPQYLTNTKYTGVAILMIANGQMSLDQIGKCVSPFKPGKNKNDLVNNRINYKPYKVEGCPRILPVQQNEEMIQGQGMVNFNEHFLRELKESLGVSYLSQDKNNFKYDKKVKEKCLNKLKELKLNQINTLFDNEQSADKISYMTSLIDRLFELLGKDQIDGLSAKIVKQGSISQLISHAIFSDTTFRQKFQNILNNCQTFKELKKYNCKDINKAKTQLFKELYTIFVELDIPEDEVQKICLQLEANPQSNIVASSTLITNATKKIIYGSSLYTKFFLRKYAQLAHYSNSLIYNAREQCRLVLDKINESAKINEEIIKKIFQFSIFDILKIATINPIKKDIFNKIVQCKSYYKVFKKIKYQKKSIESLSQDQLINISFALKDLFLKINLPFQSWQQAQKNFLLKKFNHISQLQLGNDNYNTLISYMFDKIQKYYYQQQKQMSYKEEMQLHIFSLLMESNISEKMKALQLLELATDTITSEQYYSQLIDQLGKGDIREYKVVLGNKNFQAFKKNDRRDIKEQKHIKQQAIRKFIYEINAQDKIRVSFEAIEAFIKDVIEGDGEIPGQYAKYITNLKQLDQKMNPPDVEEEEEEEEVPMKKKPESKSPSPKKKGKINPEELKKQFDQEAATFAKAYKEAEEDSRFQKGLGEKFSNDTSAYIKKIIQSNAFVNPESTFFTDLAYNNPITRQFKAQFAKNAPTYAAKLKRATQILTILSEAGGQAPEPKEAASPTKGKGKGVDKGQLEAEFVNLSKTFVAEYISKFQDCILQKGFDKMGKDATKFVREIIQKNALTNEQSEFFASLGLNGPITRKLKSQFKENAAYMSEKLKRCIEIEGLLK